MPRVTRTMMASPAILDDLLFSNVALIFFSAHPVQKQKAGSGSEECQNRPLSLHPQVLDSNIHRVALAVHQQDRLLFFRVRNCAFELRGILHRFAIHFLNHISAA